jgi:hypothetical protein
MLLFLFSVTGSLDSNDDPISMYAELANFFLHNAVGIWLPEFGEEPCVCANF